MDRKVNVIVLENSTSTKLGRSEWIPLQNLFLQNIYIYISIYKTTWSFQTLKKIRCGSSPHTTFSVVKSRVCFRRAEPGPTWPWRSLRKVWIAWRMLSRGLNHVFTIKTSSKLTWFFWATKIWKHSNKVLQKPPRVLLLNYLSGWDYLTSPHRIWCHVTVVYVSSPQTKARAGSSNQLGNKHALKHRPKWHHLQSAFLKVLKAEWTKMTMSRIRMSHDGNAKFMTLPTSEKMRLSHYKYKSISFCRKFRG